MCAGEGVARLLAACWAGRAAAPGPAAAPERPVRLTVAASGDLLIHTPVAQRALALGGGRRYDFAPMFAPVRPLHRGRRPRPLPHRDAARAGPGAGLPELPHAARPRALDPAGGLGRLQHRLEPLARRRPVRDRHDAARAATAPACRHAGTARSARERRRTTMLRVKGVTVAFLSYTAVSNGQAVPHPWSVNWASPGRILRDARRARRRGARIVIVNLHWGTEFMHAGHRRSSGARAAAHALAGDRRDRRAARARGAADPAHARQAGRVRRGQPGLEPDRRPAARRRRRTG